jgi:hypothetical protein
MNHCDPTSPLEALPASPVSSATSEPPVAGSSRGAGAAPPPPPAPLPGSLASVTMGKLARRPMVRRLESEGKSGWILRAVLMCAVIGFSAGCATSPSATTASPSATSTSPAPTSGLPAPGGGGANARSGPASGGASGTVDSVSASSFTVSTSAGQKVTVNEASSTAYLNGTSTTSSAITTGESVLVLGTTSGTTITATQVIVQPNDGGGSAASSAAGVIPFQRGAPSTSKQVGQIPANYSEGSGTIVSGTEADRATEAALAAYPGGVVDRVVKLSDGEYEVHYIGVNWPHHVFVDQGFSVVGAN